MAENSPENSQVKFNDTHWVLAFSAGLYQPMPPKARRDLIDQFRLIRAEERARCAYIAWREHQLCELIPEALQACVRIAEAIERGEP